jgi:hypothetical protein
MTLSQKRQDFQKKTTYIIKDRRGFVIKYKNSGLLGETIKNKQADHFQN